MLQDSPDPIPTNTTAFENELLVRGFIDAVNGGAAEQMEAFLHPHVTYRGTPGALVRGRHSLLASFADSLSSVSGIRVVVRTVGLTHEAVLVEHGLMIRRPDGSTRWRNGFAVFEVRDFQILEWRQVYG